MAEILTALLIFALGLLVGALSLLAWLEYRHRCVPHNPRDCGEVD